MTCATSIQVCVSCCACCNSCPGFTTSCCNAIIKWKTVPPLGSINKSIISFHHIPWKLWRCCVHHKAFLLMSCVSWERSSICYSKRPVNLWITRSDHWQLHLSKPLSNRVTLVWVFFILRCCLTVQSYSGLFKCRTLCWYMKLVEYCWFSLKSPVNKLENLDTHFICCGINVLKQNKVYGLSVN